MHACKGHFVWSMFCLYIFFHVFFTPRTKAEGGEDDDDSDGSVRDFRKRMRRKRDKDRAAAAGSATGNGSTVENEEQGKGEGEGEGEEQEFVSDGTYRNKQRVLLFSSRGITSRFRHLLTDLRKLIPHHKKVRLSCVL